MLAGLCIRFGLYAGAEKIVQGETAEIRCQLVKEGNYDGSRFFIRYFQTDGKGELRIDDGTVLLPNDLYPLD